MANGMRETQMRVWAQDAQEQVRRHGNGARGVGRMAAELSDGSEMRSLFNRIKRSFEEVEGQRKQIEDKLKRLAEARTDRNEEARLIREVETLVDKAMQEAKNAEVMTREFDHLSGELSRVMLTSTRELSATLEEVKSQARRQRQAAR